jgi:hypothetical protein
MGFVQFYFGLPRHGGHLTFIPIYHKYKVYAYEYLEKRFDLKTRSPPFCSCSREVGYRHYHLCPAIILSAILGDLNYMTIAIGFWLSSIPFRDKSGKRDPKTANVRVYVDHFFLTSLSAQR